MRKNKLPPKILNVGLVEIEIKPLNSIQENIAETIYILNSIKPNTLDLVVMPELWITGAFDFDKMSQLDQDSVYEVFREMSNISRSKGLYIHSGTHPLMGSLGKLTNTTVIFDKNGSIISNYDKVHLFGFSGGEKLVFDAGNQVNVWNFDGITVGNSTCYDLRFPEIYIQQVLSGAEILIVSAGWPEKRIAHWNQLLVARAIESQAFVLGCNASGISASTRLGGNSMAISPNGDELTPIHKDGIQQFRIDISHVIELRAEFPVLSDRVPIKTIAKSQSNSAIFKSFQDSTIQNRMLK